MAETRQDRVTLATIFALLQDRDRLFILRRMGPHECEAVAEGTVRELRSTKCVEVCGDYKVERLALDLGENPEPWADDPLPVLIITIGGKAEISEIDRFSADLVYQPDKYELRPLVEKHERRANEYDY